MTYFARFMVDKGYVSSDDLIGCILKEQESSPTVGHLVRQLSLLSSDDHLKVIEKQADDGLSFREAAIELGLWQTSFDQQIQQEAERSKKTFMSYLVEAEILPFEKITEAMDDFIAAVEDEEIQLNTRPDAPATTSSDSSAKNVESGYSWPEFAFDPIEPGLLEEYQSLITPEIVDELKAAIGEFTPGNPGAVETVEDQFNAIKAGASFVGAKFSSYILESIVNCLEFVKTSENQQDTNEIVSHTIQLVEGLAKISQFLASDPDESKAWGDLSLKNDLEKGLEFVAARSQKIESAA